MRRKWNMGMGRRWWGALWIGYLLAVLAGLTLWAERLWRARHCGCW